MELSFDKAYDEDKLFEEIEYLLKSFDQWCGYTSQEIWEYWNDNKKDMNSETSLFLFDQSHYA